jgi:hypothetical protein
VEKEGGEMGRWEVGALKCVPAPRKTWSGVGVGRGGCGHGCVRTVGWEGHMSVPHGGRLMVCVRRSRTRERAGENASGPLCVCLGGCPADAASVLSSDRSPLPAPPYPLPHPKRLRCRRCSRMLHLPVLTTVSALPLLPSYPPPHLPYIHTSGPDSGCPPCRFHCPHPPAFRPPLSVPRLPPVPLPPPPHADDRAVPGEVGAAGIEGEARPGKDYGLYYGLF